MKQTYVKLIWFIPVVFGISCQSQDVGRVNDWSQWRGPDCSGLWIGGPEIDHLAERNIDFIWETPIGSGYSGPTVAAGFVYIMDYKEGKEGVICFKAENGEKIWEYRYTCEYSVGYPTGPRTSVLINDGLAYSFGTMGHLFCFDAKSGEVKWHHNSMEAYNSRIPTWGLAASPVIESNRLIVQLGGTQGACLVAFNKITGEEIWRALDDEASYSTPILINQAGKEVLVCWTGERIAGLDPASGNVYWTIPFVPGKMIMNVASPVYDSPYLFLSGFFDGSYLLKLHQEKTEAELVYHRHGESEKVTDALHCCISTPIIKDNYIYGVDSYGEVRCLDLITGDRIWEDLTLVPKGRWANIHFVMQGEYVWGFNEAGMLSLGKFTPKGYEDFGKVKIIDPVRISPNPRNGVCWAHPAFSANRIFARSDAKLVCLEVGNP